MLEKYKNVIIVFSICILCFGIHTLYKNIYKNAYDAGYMAGYDDGFAEHNALPSTVQTETKIVYKEIPYNGNDVQVHTEKPTVTVSVNGKKQEIQQHTTTADLAVQTETNVKIKIPERKYVFGIGTDGKGVNYMLKTPMPFVKNDALGLWIAGGKRKVMGGITISF